MARETRTRSRLFDASNCVQACLTYVTTSTEDLAIFNPEMPLFRAETRVQSNSTRNLTPAVHDGPNIIDII